MTRKRHSAEQIVAILRQIEVESADHKRIGLVYTSIHALNSKVPTTVSKLDNCCGHLHTCGARSGQCRRPQL